MDRAGFPKEEGFFPGATTASAVSHAEGIESATVPSASHTTLAIGTCFDDRINSTERHKFGGIKAQ